MLALALLTVLPPPAAAAYYNLPDQRGIQIHSENLGSRTIYAGDQNISFYVRVLNSNGDDLDDDNPIRHCNASFETVVRDMDGNVIGSPILEWDAREVDNDATIFDGYTSTFSNFQFDLRPDCDVRTYNLTFCLRYENAAGTAAVFYSYVSFAISPRAAVSRVTGLYPGDWNRDVSIYVDFNVNSLEDLRLNIAVPDDDFSWFGSSGQTASVFRLGVVYYNWEPHFAMSVSKGKSPGVYRTAYTLQCRNAQDIVCSERGEMEFGVGCLPMVETEVISLVLEQGAYDTEVPIGVTNVGNVNLYDVRLAIAQPSLTYVHQKADHYEGERPVGSSRVTAGDMKCDESVGASMPIVLDPLIPMGTHRILVDITGFYYDPIEGSHKVMDLVWTASSIGYVAMVDVGTEVVTLSPERSLMEGPSFMLEVVDPTVDLTVTCHSDVRAASALDSGSVLLSLRNFGNIDYGDVSVCVETGTEGSPFVNHLNPSKSTSEYAPLMVPLTVGSLVYVQVPVAMKEGVTLGIHTVNVHLAMVDMNMGREVTTVMPVAVDVRGMGPLLLVTSLDPVQVAPGEDFTLRLTISNVGDDSALGVLVTAPPDGDGGAGGGAPGPETDGDVTPPMPRSLPVQVDDIAPGSSKVVEIEMITNPDMSPGHVYTLRFGLDYTDSYGARPSGLDHAQEVSFKATGDGGSVEAGLYSSASSLLWVAIVVMVVLAVMYSIGKAYEIRGRRPPRQSRADTPQPSPTPPQAPPPPAPQPAQQQYDPGEQYGQPQAPAPQLEYPPPQA